MGPISENTLEPTDVEAAPPLYKQASKVPPFRTVLACTDLSPASRPALQEAGRLCGMMGAHLVLLHSCETSPLSARAAEGAEDLAEQFCIHDRELLQYADELRAAGISVETVFEEGTPSDVILKYMASRNIDLAILGTHGMAGRDRLFCGSTAEEVLRTAHCPVVTVGPRAARNKVSQIGPVVFATDFHASSTEGVRYAASLAVIAKVSLHCPHVLPLAMEGEGKAPIIPHVMTEALRHLLAQKQIDLNDVVCDVIYGSEVSQAVVDYAKAHNAQAIVLGVKRASWLVTHLAPHVTYRIIVTAPCPVLTISSDFETSPLQATACL